MANFFDQFDAPAPSDQAPPPDAGGNFFDQFDEPQQQTQQQRPQAEGAVTTFGRAAAHGVVPGAGAIAGAEAGAELGSPLGPFGSLAGAVVGGVAGAYLGSKAQQTGMDALGYDDSQQMAANAQEHPVAEFAGELAPAVATMRPDRAATLLQRGVSGGVMAGLEGVQEYENDGTVNPTKVLTAGAVGAALPGQNRVGETAGAPGRRFAKKIAGRPNVAANPNAAPAQDEAKSSQQPPVEGEASTVQVPPSVDGDTVGNPQSQPVRSDRVYVKGQTEEASASPDILSQGEYSPDIAAALDAFRNTGNTDKGNPQVDVDASLREAPVQTGFPQQAQAPQPAPPTVTPNSAKPKLVLKRAAPQAPRVPEPEAVQAAQQVAAPQQSSAPEPDIGLAETHPFIPGAANPDQGLLDASAAQRRAAAPKGGLDQEPPAPALDVNRPAAPQVHPEAQKVAEVRDDVAQPTPAQADAGNFAKGHPGRLFGREVSIETPKGGVREDTKNTPPAWRVENFPYDYGEFLGTKGADGDRVDVGVVGTGDRHFIIDQKDPATGKFDEHKVMAYAKDPTDALDHYYRGFNDGSGESRVQSIKEVTADELRSWLAKPGKKSKPFDENTAAQVQGPTEGVKPLPKVVTVAVTKMKAAGLPQDAIDRLMAMEPSARLGEASRYVNETASVPARPDRIRTAPPVVEGIKDDAGKPVTARSKADAARKSADVKTMNDAYERFGTDVELPTTPEEKAALRARVQQFADDTAGVKYKPSLKHAPYLLQRAAKKLLVAKNPSDKSWQEFAGTVKQLASGDEASVRAANRTESDIGLSKRSGDEVIANAEAAQAHSTNTTEDEMIEALDRARASEFKPDIAPEEEEPTAPAEPATPESIARERAATKTLDVTKPKERAQAEELFTQARSTNKGGAVGSAKGPIALEGSENKAGSEVRKIDVASLPKDYVQSLMERAGKKGSGGRLDSDDIVKAMRNAPKNSTSRQLGEAFVRDESGAVHLGKIADDLKDRAANMRKFFESFSPSSLKDMSHKPASGYRARDAQTPAEKAQYYIAEELHKLDNERVIHKLSLQQQAADLPKELNDPKVLRRLYDAREAGKIGLLNADEQALYNRYLKPVFDENDQLFSNIEAHKPGMLGPKVGGDHVYRMVKGAHDLFNDSDPLDQQRVDALASVMHHTMLERKFFSMEDAKGNRFLISPNKDGFTVWHNRKPIKVVDPSFKYEAGKQYTVGGKTFTMGEAMTHEIEQHGKFDDGTKAEYYHNAALSAYAANYQLGEIARHLNFLEGLKNSEAMRQFMVPPGTKDVPADWRTTRLKNFDGWKMQPELAHGFDQFAQSGFNDDGLAKLRDLSSFITKAIFFNPVPHIGNVGVHWSIGRGFRWLPLKAANGKGNYRNLAETGMEAIKSVLNAKSDPFYQKAMSSGASLMYGRVITGDFMDNLAKGVGEAIEKNPSKWDPIAQKLGVDPRDLVKAVYKASSRMMWAANDMFMLQGIKENMRAGMGMRQAIIETERHVPNYRLPAAIMGSKGGARVFAQLMGERAAFVFGPYHYGVFNEYANIVKDLVKGNGRAKLDAVGNLMVMGALAFAVYPVFDKAAKLLTGNPDASVNRRGALGIPHHVAATLNAKEDISSALRSSMTVSPLPTSFMQLYNNRDWRGKDIVERGDVYQAARGSPRAAGHVAEQAGGYLAKSLIAPVNTAAQIASRPDRSIAGGVRDQLLDIRNPSPQSRKFMANAPRRYGKQAVQRQKHGEF